MTRRNGPPASPSRAQRASGTRRAAPYLFFAAVLAGSLAVGWWSADGVKAQWVRLLDVFFYGPLLVWLAWRLLPASPLLAAVLLFMGATTISYNARNYTILSLEGASLTASGAHSPEPRPVARLSSACSICSGAKP